MYQRSRALVLQWLKVPAEPHPPVGDPASLRVFRAGKHFLTLRLIGWAIPQVLALVGIIFWTVVLLDVEEGVREKRHAAQTTPPPASVSEGLKSAMTPLTSPPAKGARKKVRISTWGEFRQVAVDMALMLPWWSFPIIWVLKVGGIMLYLAQIPFTYAVRRLDYEMRWYVVTDRSLRIRTGVWKLQELTMSFANLQQVVVTQDPVQRFLGLADVRVQSAGGGGGEGPKKGRDQSLHIAMFHCVDNASDIRDLILERLRKFRATGLGDPDDHPDHPVHVAAPAAAPASDAAALEAAKELLTEARALRRALAK